MFSSNSSGLAVLTNDQLFRKAPAIFAQAPSASVSEKYSFLKTIEVVDALRGAGWNPVFAGQGKARDVNAAGLQKHIVRFRHNDAQIQLSDAVFPELVLTNSHNGLSAYQLHAGLFRMVCGNGLVIADTTFSKVAIRHSNVALGEVVDASFSIVKDLPRIGESVEAMRAVTLTSDEQGVFAAAATKLRWDAEVSPVNPQRLLTARRYSDNKPDLWTTFNNVQENLVNGGIMGRSTTGRRMRTRAIGSVTEDVKLNKALWHLAEEMGKIKRGVVSAEVGS